MCHAGEGKVANGMTGATSLRSTAHAKKKKARNDVCGAAPPSPELPKTGATPAVAVPPKKN